MEHEVRPGNDQRTSLNYEILIVKSLKLWKMIKAQPNNRMQKLKLRRYDHLQMDFLVLMSHINIFQVSII